MAEQTKLTREQRETLEADIKLAENTLNDLSRYERAGIDVSKQRASLQEVIDRNKKLLKEFSE